MDLNRYIQLKELKRSKNLKDAENRKKELFLKYPELKALENQRLDAELRKNIHTLRKQSISKDLSKIASLQKKWAETLAKIGLSDQDFSPVFECELCQDTGYAEKRICDCVRKLMASDLRETYELSAMLQSQNFKSFRADHFSNETKITIGGQTLSQRELMNFNLERARKFVADFPNGESLLFVGGTGLGKTFLANCIADALLSKGFSVVYYRHAALEILMNEMMSYNRDEDTVTRNSALRSADLLIIDDLSAPRFENLGTALFELIDERQSSNRSVILTTNMNSEEIADHLGERFHSRLHKYKTFTFLGEDTRIKKN